MTRDDFTDIQWACRDLPESEKKTVLALMENMHGRRGFRVDSVDEETLKEWAEQWAKIVRGR
jgi:hypothetical protein